MVLCKPTMSSSACSIDALLHFHHRRCGWNRGIHLHELTILTKKHNRFPFSIDTFDSSRG